MTSLAGQATAATRVSTPLKLEPLLQINVATLVVLSTLLLATGQQNLLYALLSLAAAVTAVVITDLKGYFQLSPTAANAAALGACVLLVLQIVQNTGDSQLLNVANILIYLEVILLLQKKDERIYWSLMALSLLQVIVAAALNLGLLFVLLLGLYVLAAVSALTLFFVLRETQPFAETRDELTDTSRSIAVPTPPTVQPLRDEGASDLANRILNRAFLRRLVRMVLVTTLGTILVFFAIPRFSNSVWESPQQTQVATVGFTEEVRLDDIVRILESSEQVMRVELTTQEGVPYDVVGEPYFRGTVLSSYRKDGSWRPFRSETANRSLQSQTSFDLARTVLQRYALRPGSHSVLFHIASCYPVSETLERFQLNTHTRQLTLSDDAEIPRSTYRYVLGTTAFRNGWQKDLLPVIRPLTSVPGDPALTQLFNPEYWLREYPSVTATASRVLANQGLDNASTFDKIKALEGHFRTSGLYRYSLEISRTRNRQLDPIEDFLRNHRSGHCEYFASALTLMLRSQQIPARIVVGFKGGDFNTVGHYYIVRQLHAHAWVEAYLAPDEVPADEIDPLEDRQLGAWLRLDPTPSGTDVIAARDRLLLVTKLRELVDYWQVLWDDYVLGLNSSRQRQAIYDPLIGSVRSLMQNLGDKAAWQQRWQSWRMSLWHVVTLALIMLTLLLLRKRLSRWLSQWLSARQGRQRRKNRYRRVDFYERLVRILARRGYRRQPHQTPLEFAATTGGQLAEIAPAVHVAGVPRRVTDAFYRVRFGGESLSVHEQQQLRLALADLDQALRQSP